MPELRQAVAHHHFLRHAKLGQRLTLEPVRIDRAAQLRLVGEAPADRVVIAESAVHTRAQGAAAELAGADAVLVGTALMRAADPAAKLREILSRPLVKVCGLTREEDVAAAVDAGADLCGFILVQESPRAAERVLPVPDTTLSVAVFVGEPGEASVSGTFAGLTEDGALRLRLADGQTRVIHAGEVRLTPDS